MPLLIIGAVANWLSCRRCTGSGRDSHLLGVVVPDSSEFKSLRFAGGKLETDGVFDLERLHW